MGQHAHALMKRLSRKYKNGITRSLDVPKTLSFPAADSVHSMNAAQQSRRAGRPQLTQHSPRNSFNQQSAKSNHMHNAKNLSTIYTGACCHLQDSLRQIPAPPRTGCCLQSPRALLRHTCRQKRVSLPQYSISQQNWGR